MRASPNASPAAVQQAIRSAASNLDLRLPEVVAEISAMLRREIAELAATRTEEETRRSSAEIIGSFLESVRRGEPPGSIEHQSPSVDVAHALAHAGAGVRTVVHMVQLGHAAALSAWEQELDALGLAPDVRLAALRRTDELTFAFADGLTRTILDEYAREHRRVVRAAEARRARTVRALLGEIPPDQDAVSRALGYELSRHHTAMVLWTADDDPDAASRIQQAAEDVARPLGAGAPLLVFAGPACGWAWAATDGPADAEALASLARSARRDRVSLGVGDPAPGAAGFRASHLDAVKAMRVAQLAGRRPGTVVLYREVELAALALDDIERTRHFVRSVLRDLAIDDDETARLRATLKVFLDCDRSRRDAAERLGLHPNTIGARVQACQELLGPDAGRRPAELRAALALGASLGSAVLR